MKPLTPDQANNRRLYLAVLAALLLALFEPALANKFETISGGVSGSMRIKRDWLIGFLYVAGGISLFGSLLAVVVPHRNALFLNHANWKTSAAIMLLIASGCFAAGYAL